LIYLYNILLVLVLLVPGRQVAECSPGTQSTDTSNVPEVVDVDYEELQSVIESYRGKKAVLLNVWATWCGPCVEELPYLRKLQEEYPDKLQVVLLSADLRSDRSRVAPFLKERGVDWKTYYKAGDNQRFLNQLSKQWSGALPFTKIIDRKGKVVGQWQGSASFDKFEKHVNKALEE